MTIETDGSTMAETRTKSAAMMEKAASCLFVIEKVYHVRYSLDMQTLLTLMLIMLLAVAGYYVYDAQIKAPEEPSQEQVNGPSPVPALTTLNRSNQGLTKLPPEILAMTNLQHLDVSSNHLTGALPAEIRHLQNLEILDISNNKMTGLPAELGQLSKLRVLSASNNKLTGIPHELGNLQNLEVLDLSDNDISQQDLQIIRSRLPSTTEIIL